MSKRAFTPDRGDLIEMNFQPAAGRQIDKRRPAIVLTPQAYNKRAGICLAVPLSSDLTPGPLWIMMPPGYLPKPSMILCDYIKSFDYRERSATLLHRLPESLVQQIVGNLLDLVDPMK